MLAGCGSADVDPDARSACGDFLRALPGHVADQRRTSVDRSSLTASYGKPAIEVSCGVEKPADLRPTSRCQHVNGIDWFAPPDEIGQVPVDTTLTTVGRDPRVRVQVPKDYWPPTAVMVDLGPVVKAHLALTTPCA